MYLLFLAVLEGCCKALSKLEPDHSRFSLVCEILEMRNAYHAFPTMIKVPISVLDRVAFCIVKLSDAFPRRRFHLFTLIKGRKQYFCRDREWRRHVVNFNRISLRSDYSLHSFLLNDLFRVLQADSTFV